MGIFKKSLGTTELGHANCYAKSLLLMAFIQFIDFFTFIIFCCIAQGYKNN